jgi:hypothetical protein
MSLLYVDASQPLQWGPMPPVGIPRVENAVVRQALRQERLSVQLFLVERDGRGRLLSPRERAYLIDMLEGRMRSLEGDAGESASFRLMATMRAIWAGAYLSGREFDRAAAGYIVGAHRKGLPFELAKVLIRVSRQVARIHKGRDVETPDPLADASARCFLSKISLHRIAARELATSAEITTLLHDMIPVDQPQYFDRHHAATFRRDLEWLFRYCRNAVCVSRWTASRAQAFVEANAPQTTTSIHVNRLGSFLSEGRERDDGEPVVSLEGRPFAIYCSTIEVRKNHIILLRSWLRLAKTLGDRLPTLVLCGRWGWIVDEVKAFLSNHPEMEGKVLFLNRISDRQLAWLYRNARFGLFPSHVEGWGLGAVECLDYGLPVLISDAAALAEATQGLMPVIPADDLDGWCAAIERAATDDAWLATQRDLIATAYAPISEAEFAGRLLALMQGEGDEADPQATCPPAAAMDASGSR